MSPKFRRSIFASPASKGLILTVSRSLPTDRVRYVGEPVAVVFAIDAYVAEDAADLVTVEVETLPELLAADAPPGEFDAGHSTEAAIVRKGFGDVDGGFCRRARRSSTLELKIGRHSGVPLETRGAIARYDAGARHARALRRRQSAALEPRRARAHARPRAIPPCICTKAIPAAALACVANFIPRTCSPASARCGSAAR